MKKEFIQSVTAIFSPLLNEIAKKNKPIFLRLEHSSQSRHKQNSRNSNLWGILLVVLLASLQTYTFAQCPNNENDLANGGTFSGNCNVDVGNSITITGNVIWTSGTLNIRGNNGDVNISGSLTINGGTVRTTNNEDGDLDILNGGELIVEENATFTAYNSIQVYDGGNMEISGTVNSIYSYIDIDAGGEVTISSTGTLSSSTTNDDDVNEDIYVQGTLNNAGTLNSDGDIEVEGSLTNSGQIDSDEEITVSGSLNNSGGIDANDDITLSGNITNSGDIDTDNDLTLSGTVNNSGDLHADDDITISGTVNNSGTIEATTNDNNDPDIVVTGTLVNDGTVFADHDITLSSTSDVTINSTGSLDARNDISLGGDLIVNGEVDGDEITIPGTGDVTINPGGLLETSDDEDMTVRGDLHIYGTVDVDNDLWIDGGNVIVHNGGELTTVDDLSVVDDATLTVNSGGSVEVGGDLSNDENTGNGGPEPSQGTIILNGTMEVNDDVAIYNTWPSGDPDEIDAGDSALIGSGTLIVNDNFTETESPHGDFYPCGGNGATCMGSGILPVTWLEFTATQHEDNNSAIINWKTATEINNYGFYIERSSDGLAFETLGFVDGNGNTQVASDYTFEDISLLSGINYYRLKQVDYDGAVDYSKVIALRVEEESYQLQLYPNPGSGNFKISGLKEEQYAITVSSVVDNAVITLPKMNSADIAPALNHVFSSKSKGLYIIIFKSSSQVIPVRYVLE